MNYKVIKTGFFGESYLNEVGSIVELHPDEANPAVEGGYLKLVEAKEKAKAKKKPKKKAKK